MQPTAQVLSRAGVHCGEFAKGTAVLLAGLRCSVQRAFGVRVVGRQQDSAVGFHRQDAVTGFETQPIDHILGQRGADGPASLTKLHRFDDEGLVAANMATVMLTS